MGLLGDGVTSCLSHERFPGSAPLRFRPSAWRHSWRISQKNLREDVANHSPGAVRKPSLTWQPERSTPSWFLFFRTQCEWRLSKRPARRLHLVFSQTLAFGVRREILLVPRVSWGSSPVGFHWCVAETDNGVAEGLAPIDVDLPLWHLSIENAATLLVP